MKILKKNQIIIFVTALMLVVAGYLSYSTEEKTDLVSTEMREDEMFAGVGDAKLVSNNNLVEAENEVNDNIENNINQDNVTSVEENNINNNATITSNINKQNDNYFVSSRLGRDTMYSQMIESYQKILENQNISLEQKAIATQEITKINETKNAIMISENLIKTKGFDEGIIFVNDKSISIILKAEELKTEQIAQIQNIIAREMKAEIENIHISNK